MIIASFTKIVFEGYLTENSYRTDLNNAFAQRYSGRHLGVYFVLYYSEMYQSFLIEAYTEQGFKTFEFQA